MEFYEIKWNSMEFSMKISTEFSMEISMEFHGKFHEFTERFSPGITFPLQKLLNLSNKQKN
jgi:hypothetical protein